MTQSTQTSPAPKKTASKRPIQKLPKADLFTTTLRSVIQNGTPLYRIKGYSKALLDKHYAVAYNLYTQEKYKEAADLFRALALYNSYDKRYWQGLAGALEMQKYYKEALSAYSFLAVLAPSDPLPALHAFDCHVAMKNYPAALTTLDTVILRASKKPVYAAVKERAETLRKILHETIQESKKQS